MLNMPPQKEKCPPNLDLCPFINRHRLTSTEWLNAGWQYVKDPKNRMRMKQVVLLCRQVGELRMVATANQARTPVFDAMFTNLDGVHVQLTAWREFAIKFSRMLTEGTVSLSIFNEIINIFETFKKFLNRLKYVLLGIEWM